MKKMKISFTIAQIVFCIFCISCSGSGNNKDTNNHAKKPVIESYEDKKELALF